jgi:hypothetical protein
MSVLSNSTHFNISNNSNKYLEVTVSSEQNSSFRIHHSSSYIVEMPRNNANRSYASWVVNGISSWTRGAKMQYVKINLPGKETVQCEINCTNALSFTTSVKDRNLKNEMEGELLVRPENQGSELHLIYSSQRGLGYTSSGDVAIGLSDLTSQNIIISSVVKTMDGHVIDIDDNSPALCKHTV